MQSQDFKMPVGRVQFLYLAPISFAEFLSATNHEQLRQYLREITLPSEYDDAVHHKLMNLLKIYLIVGGMPTVVKEYVASNDLLSCQRLQHALLQTYRGDFGKYAKSSENKYLQKVFDSAPRLVGKRVKYSHIDPESTSRDLKNAVHLLTVAGIVSPVYATAAAGLPLGSQTNDAKFKMIFLDVGLMQNACGLHARLKLETDVMQINAGAVTEQFAGQELKAYLDHNSDAHLYFWARDKKNSSAEIDYLITVDSRIVPVEVKAGKTGTLRSLKLFMEERKSSFGVRFSQDRMSYFDNVLTIPLYMIEQTPRLVRETGSLR